MSLYGVQNAMYQLKKDKALQARFKQDAVRALEGHDLTAAERDALVAGDLAGLYRMGVHPLLLAPYSRMMGIPRPKYQELLTPLKGVQQLRS
jgi:hypothetical protein